MTVGRILQAKGRAVVTIAPEASLREAAVLLRDRRIGALVVSAGAGRIDGILSERDLVHRLAEHGPAVLDAPVESVMTRQVSTCRDADTLSELMTAMTRGRVRHLPVVDDAGRLAGMISIGDVVKARLDEIEAEAESLREYIASAV